VASYDVCASSVYSQAVARRPVHVDHRVRVDGPEGDVGRDAIDPRDAGRHDAAGTERAIVTAVGVEPDQIDRGVVFVVGGEDVAIARHGYGRRRDGGVAGIVRDDRHDAVAVEAGVQGSGRGVPGDHDRARARVR